jgi:hypothetical protein
MERFTKIFIILSIFLIIGVSMAGCSDSPDPAASGSTSGTVAATTTAGPLYTAGDIVRSASGSESPAWLVVSYDPAGDSYTRALIYKNSDGSYGYRVNSNAETSKRATMEKVFTVKITHVAVSSVPTAAPTTVTTAATPTTARTTTTTAAAKTTSSARPGIKAMDPEEGEAGTTVSVEITGNDFLSNLTAMLRRSDQTSIKATTISWYSSSSVTATFDIPNSTKVGTWDIVVTNPNGLSGEYTNYFTVHGNKSAT